MAEKDEGLPSVCRLAAKALEAIGNLNADAISRLTKSASDNTTNNRTNVSGEEVGNVTPENANSLCIDELRRRFPTFGSSQSNNTSRKRKKKESAHSTRIGKSGRPSKQIIHKDLVIIPNPETTQVPSHGNKVNLEERGLVIHEFPFDKAWDARTLRRNIYKQFPEENEVVFEFVKACYGTLVKPKFASGVDINTEMVLKLAGQGAVYVRCLTLLEDDQSATEEVNSLPTGYEGIYHSDHDMSDVLQNDSDLELPDPHLFHRDHSLPDDVSNYTGATYSAIHNIPVPSHRINVVDTNDDSLNNIVSSNSVTHQFSNTSASVSSAYLGDSSSTSSSSYLGESSAITSDVDKPTQFIRVHRELIKQEMMELFSNPSLMGSPLHATIINQYGKEEAGEGTGVLRELFSVFWKEFYESHMLGEDARVPYIRHDYNREKWEAVGRILVKGFLDCSYFPLKLSKVFFGACLFGETGISYDMLIQSFKLYVSKTEADLIEQCLKGDIKHDDDELLSFLSNFDCKRRVTDTNMMEIINEIAHKELIQKPQYVSDCWKDLISPMRLYFTEMESLNTYYDSIHPTTNKVIALLKANPLTSAEVDTMSHLKRFIRGLDPERLATFLRFTTASDIIVCDKIEISFLNVEGLQRRPVAHTCGYLLEIPSTYNNFCELREELTSVLISGSWEIDIV